jgi:cysteinyl-tRNA synthetase
MHAGAIRVGKDKMSKSLGNFKTIREELKTYSGETIRYFLISSHYRSQVEYSPVSLNEVQSALDRFYQALRGIAITDLHTIDDNYQMRFDSAMCDDFNTPEALAVMFDLVKALNSSQIDAEKFVLAATLVRLGGILGILQQDPEAYFKSTQNNVDGAVSEEEIEAMITERASARAKKDWAESDRIRDKLTEQGVVLDDAKGVTSWRRL